MLDRRDALLDQLSQIMPVRAVTDQNGTMTVFGAGQVLIDGTRQNKLATVANPANGGCQEVVIQDCAGNNVSLAPALTSGTLGGLIQARDTYAKDAQDQVDRVSAQLIQQFNIQHRAGTGLDGVSGRDFFSGLAAQATPAWNNKGGVSVDSATVTDDTQLTFDNYEVRFTSANQFDVVDTTSGTTVSSANAYVPGGNIDFAGLRLVLNNGAKAPAAGDAIAVNSYAGTAGRIDLSAAVKANTDAIAAGQTSAAGDNTNALKLADLETLGTMGQPPSQTFEQYYDAARLKVAMASQSAQSRQTDAQTTQSQIQGLSDAVSGVSVDEEATNIIQFQRAFQASSQVISVTDQLLQSLMTMMPNT
jgi:flagellar hook-associated protein 1 FlgK